MKNKIFGISVFLAIFALFVYFISKNISIIRETINVTTENLTSYGLVALILSALSYVVGAYAFKKILSIFGIKRSLLETLNLELRGLAANIIIPSGGLAGALIYAEDANNRGESRGAAISAGVFWLLVDYLAISIMLILAMIYLWTISALHSAVWIPALIFFGLTGLLYILAMLSAEHHNFAKKIILKGARFLSKFLKKLRTKNHLEEIVEEFVTEFANVNRHLTDDKKRWFKLVLIIFLKHLVNVAVLYLIFASFGADATWRNVIVGYAVGTTIVVISPTPMGIGFVEAAMTLTYVNLGLSSAVASTTAIIYRAYIFWIPFFIGFLILQRSRLKKIREETQNLRIE